MKQIRTAKRKFLIRDAVATINKKSNNDDERFKVIFTHMYKHYNTKDT